MRFSFIIVALSSAFLLNACLHVPVHQGNRLDGDNIYFIKKGDTKFSIEQKLGTPVLNNTLHPDRATYYEEFEDEDSGKVLWRYVEIIYDSAKRAQKITRVGFEVPK